VSFNEETNSLKFSNPYSEHALSGIIRYLPDFLILHAPTVNSYKRLKESTINENWNKVGFQRTDCGVNIIEEGKIQKIHFNISGSDVNQYFSLFGIVNSVRYLIINVIRSS
jgi:glutamine synthetase